MSKYEKYIGNTLKLFMKNGYYIDDEIKYDIEGVLKYIDEEQIIIQHSLGIFLIFKTEVSMILLNIKEFNSSNLEKAVNTEYHKVSSATKKVDEKLLATDEYSEFSNIIETNQYGSVLPMNLLEKEAPYNPDDDFGKEQENFSISSAMMYNNDMLIARAKRMEKK